MEDFRIAIIAALLSSVITGLITALIQPVVDNWLSYALKSKKIRIAVRISIIVIIFAIVSVIVFFLCVYNGIGNIFEKDTTISDDSTTVTDTIAFNTSSNDNSSNSSSEEITLSTEQTTQNSSEDITINTEQSTANSDVLISNPSIVDDIPNIVADQVIASPGEIIQFKVYLINNPGIYYEKFTVNLGCLEMYTNKASEEIDTHQAKDGPIASYELKVPENAQIGDVYPIHIEITEVVDADGVPIPCNVVDGQVIIQ